MTMRKTIREQFDALNPVEGSLSLGIPCGPDEQHLLVKNPAGEPLLLLRSTPRRQPRAPIRLKNVVVEFERRYGYSLDDYEATDAVEVADCFTAIRCLADASTLYSYFVEMMSATAAGLPAPLSEAQVDNVVTNLLELFKSGNAAGQSTVAGLWGELLVISVSADTTAIVKAWHLDTSDSFDFALSERRIEVKSSEKQMREHEFSLGQVSERRDGDYIASVLLKRSAAGVSTLELAEQIAARLDDASRAKFWGLVFHTLGDDAALTNDTKYDLKFSKDSLRFIPSNRVPCPTLDEEGRRLISHVHFRANIESIVQDFGIVKLI